MNQSPNLFTGRTRARRPKRSVLLADRAAHWVISLGGIGSIVAVSLVGVFLLYVVLPLFLPPRLAEAGSTPAGLTPARIVHAAVDDYLTVSWTLHRDGSIYVRRLDDGLTIRRLEVPDAPSLTCWTFGTGAQECAFGYGDGSIRLGRIGFTTAFLGKDEVPVELAQLPVGKAAPLREGIVLRTPEDQLRYQELELALGDSLPVSTQPIVLIDRSEGGRGSVIAALDAAGTLFVSELREQRNFLTGETTITTGGGRIDLRTLGIATQPAYLLLTGLGDSVMLVWRDGRLLRFDTSDPTAPALAEEIDLIPEAGHQLTAMSYLLGKSSLLCGDDLGRVSVWFRVRGADGTSLVLAHTLGGGDGASPVTCLTPSARTRMVAVGHADGSAFLWHVTSHRRLAKLDVAAGEQPVDQIVLGPRDDLLLALAGGRAVRWTVDAPHPEVNARSLLGKVWYEGHDAPAYIWQSSAADDGFEPKYSLVPLIFGTLKATLYSLLIGLPLAWFAAIYTSEFVAPSAKARIKPTIELMASLPSVVLGFLAALVLAPFLERFVPQALVLLAIAPLCFLTGAYLWQLLPREWGLRLGAVKLPLIAVSLAVAVLLARGLGGTVERLLFGGDVMSWLDGQQGSGVGGWVFVLLPLCGGLVFMYQTQVVDAWLRSPRHRWTRARFAAADFARFAGGVIATVALAFAASWLLAEAGLDPRGAIVDTYVQRNALVVGVAMGFAIIPIIYTISEDALSAVPDHLRAASLGAGATPWQTAVRVVIPPATSGLFSAMMIGLGRAVGETMIVLMAAGNTPIMDWNIFNGFRTLSANIAVELPEAVQNSTHYRILFLAALALFAITFGLNTAAEAVRIRFRKKSLEL